LTLISKFSFRKIERFFRKVLGAFHLKFFVYKMVIIPSQMFALHRLRKVMKNSSPIERKDLEKKVLFISVDARHMPHTYLEGGIAKALEIRGHNPKMLMCNGILNMCTSHFTVDNPKNCWNCENCIRFSKKFYEIAKLPYATFDQYITPKEVETIQKTVSKMTLEQCEKHIYKDICVGYHATTSAKRYFKGDKPSNEEYEPILRSELINAMITTDVAAKAYLLEKADILVSSHGCYSSWGSFTDYFINRKTPAYIWGSGETNTVKFVYPKSDFNKYFEEVRHKKLLNKLEENEIDNFFNRRSLGKEGQVTLYGFSKTKEDELKKQFNFEKYDKTYVMFPNVPWDTATFGDEDKMAFKDTYDWFLHTVELFKDKPKMQLIVKIHPSEVKVMESKRTINDFIAEKFDSLPENIKIIPPDTTINPYSLFPFIDVGLVYTGTVGLEMSMHSIPVIPAGDAHYANKGFTHDVSTKEEYTKMMFDNISVSPNQQNMAKLYAHFHFIKNFVPRDFISTNNFITTGWTFKSLDDLEPGKNKYIDHICNYIINGGIYQDW